MKTNYRKKPYAKPTIKVVGNVEAITLKQAGASDAFLLHGLGQSEGSGVS